MNTINLNLIHQLLKYKQFYYSMSVANTVDNNLYIDFSTGPHTRGGLIELRLGDTDNDIRYSSGDKTDEKKNMSHEELIKYITNNIN